MYKVCVKAQKRKSDSYNLFRAVYFIDKPMLNSSLKFARRRTNALTILTL